MLLKPVSLSLSLLCLPSFVDQKAVFSYVSEIGDEPRALATPPVVTATEQGAVVEEAALVATQPKDPLYAYTVAVGKKPSLASHWFHDAQEVGELLLTLTNEVRE